MQAAEEEVEALKPTREVERVLVVGIPFLLRVQVVVCVLIFWLAVVEVVDNQMRAVHKPRVAEVADTVACINPTHIL